MSIFQMDNFLNGDIDEMLEFQGETCPYIQYMYVRINSILRKLDNEVLINDVKYDKLHDDLSYDLVKQIYSFNDIFGKILGVYLLLGIGMGVIGSTISMKRYLDV